MPKRVLFLTDCNPAVYSGGRYHAFMMAEAAALAGYDVTIWAPAQPIFWADFANFPAHGKLVLHKDRFETRPEGVFDIVVLIPDGGRSDRMHREALRIAKRDQARVIFLNFESGNWFNSMSPTPRPLEAWDLWQRSVKFCDMILSSAKESTKHAKAFYLDVPPHLIFEDCNPSINSVEADAVWERRRKPENQVLVVSRFGAASKHKGVDQLLDLFGDKHAGLKIVLLAGTGALPGKQVLDDMAAAFTEKGLTLEILHNVSDSEKFEAIARSRALIFPTMFEGYGYPPIEAQYVGRPCVTYDLPVLREVSGNGATYVPIGDRAAFREAIDAELAKPLTDRRERKLRSDIADVAGLDAYATRVDRLFRRVIALKADPAALSYEDDRFVSPGADVPALPDELNTEASALHVLLKNAEVTAFATVFRARVAFLKALAESPEHRNRFVLALADNPVLAVRLLKVWLSRKRTRPAVESAIREMFDVRKPGDTLEGSTFSGDALAKQLSKGGRELNSLLLAAREYPALQRSFVSNALLTTDAETMNAWLFRSEGEGGGRVEPDLDTDKAARKLSEFIAAAGARDARSLHDMIAENSELMEALAEVSVGRRSLRDALLTRCLRRQQGRSAITRAVCQTVEDEAEFASILQPLLRKSIRMNWMGPVLAGQGNAFSDGLLGGLIENGLSSTQIDGSIKAIFEARGGVERIAADDSRVAAIIRTLFDDPVRARAILYPFLSEPDGQIACLSALLNSEAGAAPAGVTEWWRDRLLDGEASLGALNGLALAEDQFSRELLKALLKRDDFAQLVHDEGDEALALELIGSFAETDERSFADRLAASHPQLWDHGIEVAVETVVGARALGEKAAQGYASALEVARALLRGEAGAAAMRQVLSSMLSEPGEAEAILIRPAARRMVLQSLSESGLLVAQIRALIDDAGHEELVAELLGLLLTKPEALLAIAPTFQKDAKLLSGIMREIPVETMCAAIPEEVAEALLRNAVHTSFSEGSSHGTSDILRAEIERNEAFCASVAVDEIRRRPSAVISDLRRASDGAQERFAEAVIDAVRSDECLFASRISRSLGSGKNAAGEVPEDDGTLVAGPVAISAEQLRSNPAATARLFRSASRDGLLAVAMESQSVLRDLKWVLPARFDVVAFEEDAIKSCKRPADVLPLMRRRLMNDHGQLVVKDAVLNFPETHDLATLIDEVLRRKAYFFETQNPAPVIIDGGANFGIATYAYLRAYPDAEVIAFEPGRRSLLSLRKNVEMNNWKNVTVYPKALAGQAGKVTFYEPKHMPMGGSLTTRLKDRDFECHTYQVETVCLSSIMDRPVDLLKLDIEGAETEVIEEVGDRIKLARRIYCEVHSTPDTSAVVRSGLLAQHLEGLGFECRTAPNHPLQSPFSQTNREHSYVLWAKQ